VALLLARCHLRPGEQCRRLRVARCHGYGDGISECVRTRPPRRTLPAQRLRSSANTGHVSSVCLGDMLMRCVRSADVPCAYAHFMLKSILLRAAPADGTGSAACQQRRRLVACPGRRGLTVCDGTGLRQVAQGARLQLQPVLD
jgi:hypothetical protein